jgi:hypothetical protein
LHVHTKNKPELCTSELKKKKQASKETVQTRIFCTAMKNLALSSIRSYVQQNGGVTMQRAMTTRKYFTHVNKPTPHTSMRSSLIASIGLLAVLGAGCTPAKPLPSATQQTATNLSPADQALRNDLEGVWKGIQASLDQPGAKGYGSFLDLELYPELAFLKQRS